ncbi:MAG: sensor histidine kinase [Prolixibacteraceae bacterium]
MKKKIFVWMTIINIAMFVFILVLEFLLLPTPVQKILSTGIYLVAAIAGIIIGGLVSKIYMLRKKINAEQLALKQKEKNIQIYLTNVVHDLRSPVASINMISELLVEEVTDIDPLYSELIHSVKKSSKMMLDRICCILDNAEAEQKCTFEEMVFENPYPIIKAAVNKHHVLAIDKNIELILDISPEIAPVFFNKEALDSVFSNLISNAIKYSLPNTRVKIIANQKNNCTVFSVKDQGLGMSGDDLSKVFGRFAKLSARPTGKEDSSGVGLSIVKTMVERMNGKVVALSDGKGLGSTFSVSLSKTPKSRLMTA